MSIIYGILQGILTISCIISIIVLKDSFKNNSRYNADLIMPIVTILFIALTLFIGWTAPSTIKFIAFGTAVFT